MAGGSAIASTRPRTISPRERPNQVPASRPRPTTASAVATYAETGTDAQVASLMARMPMATTAALTVSGPSHDRGGLGSGSRVATGASYAGAGSADGLQSGPSGHPVPAGPETYGTGSAAG